MAADVSMLQISRWCSLVYTLWGLVCGWSHLLSGECSWIHAVLVLGSKFLKFEKFGVSEHSQCQETVKETKFNNHSLPFSTPRMKIFLTFDWNLIPGVTSKMIQKRQVMRPLGSWHASWTCSKCTALPLTCSGETEWTAGWKVTGWEEPLKILDSS